MENLDIRWILHRDTGVVQSIENVSFEFPWTEEEFIRVLRQRDCIGMVCQIGDDVLGYMIYKLCKSKLELINFAVHPNYRRKGVGSAMVERLIAKLSYQRRNRIELLVMETNMPALMFFRSNGFEATRVIRNAYIPTVVDGIAMRYVRKVPTEADYCDSFPMRV